MKHIKLILTIVKNLFLIIMEEIVKLFVVPRRRKWTIGLIVVLAIAAGGFWGYQKKYSSAKPQEVTVREDAQVIAKKFLGKQTYKKDYETEPVAIETYPEFWNVWFATKDKNKRPNRGLVQINRATGQPEWKELQ